MTAGILVFVGTAGWEYPGWHNGFYPDGLPEDWRLSYYNTQFQAVYLPAAVWQAASEAAWAQWLNDTRDDFHFVLEAGNAHAHPLSNRIVSATPAWEAEHVWWLDEDPDMRRLAQRIGRQAQSGEPLFVFSRSGNLGLLEQARSLKQVMGC